jgi:hypothetical protein
MLEPCWGIHSLQNSAAGTVLGVMAATCILFYTPILLLAYHTIEYTAAIGAGQGSLPMIHQCHFSLMMVPILLIVAYRMEYSQLMEWKGTLEDEKMRRKRTLYS